MGMCSFMFIVQTLPVKDLRLTPLSISEGGEGVVKSILVRTRVSPPYTSQGGVTGTFC